MNTSLTSANDSDEPSQSLNRSIDIFDCGNTSFDAVIPCERENSIVNPEFAGSQNTILRDNHECKNFDEIKDNIEKDIYSEIVPIFEGITENKM